jgi:1-acyl-sn-glycerol-3-phosphate acyltransferase
VFYNLFKYVLLGPLLRLYFRPRIEGLENIPEEGAAIVAGNHLATSEYFTGPGLKGRLTAAFFRSVGQIPVDRSGKGAGQAAIDEGLGVLAKRELLGIYPEGTRSHDGRLYKGRVGVASMALQAGVKVIPCAMVGTFELQPPGRKMPRFGRVTIRFGKPLDFSRYAGMESERTVLRAVVDEIIHEILELSGQEYVDLYAPDAKAQQAKEREEARTRGKREESAKREDSGKA